MIELAMPAGSMQCGLVALRDGADAIYLGLRNYSARKGAVNFSIEEYSKIFRYAHTLNKKVYVTINTVIHDAQLATVMKILKSLQIIGSDGIIVQDLGVAKIVRDNFPSLPLHGSTQLAVHSVEGVKAMETFGFERVVLSRELTIEEIEKIRNKCKEIELKVFIHGALCYGFSGLCMASNIITGRSANAGACAQICRTWFSYNDKNGYFFSMKDLEISDSVKKLRDINIDSLKVEGRMKSPSYVSAVTKYYRAILDNEPFEDLYENMKTTFSRESSKGWIDNYKENKVRLVEDRYPSHKGLAFATVEDLLIIRNRKYALLSLDKDIAIHDGVMFLREVEGQVIEPVKFSVSSLLDLNRNQIKREKKFNKVLLSVSDREWGLCRGDTLYLIKRHNQDEKLINTDRLPFTKNYGKAKFIISDTSISIVASFAILNEIKVERHINIEKSNKQFDYKQKIENIFSQSGDSFFEVSSLEIVNNTSYDFSNIFLPLAEIKKLRRAFYNEVDLSVDNYINEELSFEDNKNIYYVEELPPRSKIKVNDLPFFENIPSSVNQLINIDGKYYLPLPPVFFNEEEQCNNLKLLVDSLIKSNLLDKVYFGINNIAHINWLRSYEVKVYGDIYFYLANRQAALNLLSTNLNVVGAYLFLETVKGDLSLWPFLPTRVDEDFVPPLFISRTNFSYDSLNNEQKDGEYYISQRDNEYKVITRGELTYLLKRN